MIVAAHLARESSRGALMPLSTEGKEHERRTTANS